MNDYLLNPKQLLVIYQRYGFIECANIQRFIVLVCGPSLNEVDLIYIREKTLECLKKHDNGDDYFTPLKVICSTVSKHIVTYVGS